MYLDVQTRDSMSGMGADEELSCALGYIDAQGVEQVGPPAPQGVIKSADEPAVGDPIWQKSDCYCRGGRWLETTSGDASTGKCIVDKPSGKMFDYATRGCVKIPDYQMPQVMDSFCTKNGTNYCLYGGIGLAVLVLLVLAAKD
jgi:hypothetical protein